MLNHETLIEMTNNLDEDVKKKDVYIAIPNKDGYMLHEVVGAELLQVDGDIDGNYGVLVASPIAAFHLDGGTSDKDHNPDEVPMIRYEYVDVTPFEEEEEEEKEDELTTESTDGAPIEE